MLLNLNTDHEEQVTFEPLFFDLRKLSQSEIVEDEEGNIFLSIHQTNKNKPLTSPFPAIRVSYSEKIVSLEHIHLAHTTKQEYAQLKKQYAILPTKISNELDKTLLKNDIVCYYHKEYDLAFIDQENKTRCYHEIARYMDTDLAEFKTWQDHPNQAKFPILYRNETELNVWFGNARDRIRTIRKLLKK